MKKLLVILAALLVLVGCNGKHHTGVDIYIEDDLSGHVEFVVSIYEDDVDVELEEIEDKVTDFIKEEDRYEKGRLTTRNDYGELKFTYTEQFKDETDLAEILSRLYRKDVKPEFVTKDSIFYETLRIEGLNDLDVESFMNPIYDKVEKDKLLKEDSSKLRSNQDDYGAIYVFRDETLYSLREDIPFGTYKKIKNDSLLVTLLDETYADTKNIIELSDDLDFKEVEAYYQQLFYDSYTLAKRKDIEYKFETDENAKIITVEMYDVPLNLLEALQNELFNRYFGFDVQYPSDQDRNTPDFTIEFFYSNHTADFDKVVDHTETAIDISDFEIFEVDGSSYIDNFKRNGFTMDGSLMILDEEICSTISFNKSGSGLANTVLFGLVIALIASALVGLILFFRKKSKKEEGENQFEEKNKKQVVKEEKVLPLTKTESVKKIEEGRLIKFSNNANFIETLKNKAFSKHSILFAGLLFLLLIVLSLLLYTISLTIMSEDMIMGGLLDSSTIFKSFFSSIKYFMTYLASGSFQVVVGMGEEAFSTFNVNIDVFTLVQLSFILVLIISFYIYKAMTKNLSDEERFVSASFGVLFYVVILAILSLFKLSISEELYGQYLIHVTMGVNIWPLFIITLPLYIIGLYGLSFFKTKLNSDFMSFSTLIYTAIKRTLILFLIMTTVSVFFILVNEPVNTYAAPNVGALLSALVSGISLYFGSPENVIFLGVFIFAGFNVIPYLLYIGFLSLYLYDLNRTYKRSKIVNKIKFSLAYTASVMLPIIIMAAISQVKLFVDMMEITVVINWITVVIATLVFFLLAYLRISLFEKIGPKDTIELDEIVFEDDLEDVDVEVRLVVKRRSLSRKRNHLRKRS